MADEAHTRYILTCRGANVLRIDIGEQFWNAARFPFPEHIKYKYECDAADGSEDYPQQVHRRRMRRLTNVKGERRRVRSISGQGGGQNTNAVIPRGQILQNVFFLLFQKFLTDDALDDGFILKTK